MAKFGEGDSRWIVQDRPDGTNVHNWHWSETDCLDFSKSFFTSSLSNLTLVSDTAFSLRTLSLPKFDGEAYVNIRKGKIIPGYDLSFSVAFEGEVRDEQGNVVGKSKGIVEVPYVSDENAGEDPEVRVTVEDGGEIGRKVRDGFLAVGKEVVVKKVREFMDVMGKGGPCRDDLEVKKVGVKSEKTVIKENSSVSQAVVKEVVKAKAKEEKERKGYKTIKLTEKFRCRAGDLYEILMDEKRWKGFTQSNAKISRDVGGEFSIFDGSVSGTNVDLQEGKLIVQKWRFGNWPDGVLSTVKLTFEEPESGVTVVKLVQTDVPEEDRYGNETVVENTERGWRDLIFQRIRVVFAFGL